VVDPNFFVNTKRVEQICNGLIEKGLNVAMEKVNGRPEQMNRFSDGLWKLLDRAGLKSVLIGAESGNEEVMRIINKDATVEDTIEFAHKAKQFNIKIVYAFMIFGTPHTDVEKTKQFQLQQYSDTLDLIKKILDISVYAHFLIFVYTPYPGTQLYDLCIKNGLREKKDLLEWSRYKITTSNVPWVPRRLAKKAPHIWNYLELYTIVCDKINSPAVSGIKKMFFKLVFGITNFRIRNKFFSFPVESLAFKFYENMKERLVKV